ncbi:MAG: hypothetical protein KDB27_26825 [Planctomycetales bacterium]|nr:hypothetical protein [Planctomycetales bacterium]
MTTEAKTQSIKCQNQLLQVRFGWHGDRYKHCVEARYSRDSDWQVIAESIEGSDREIWPSSPPFQQVESHIGGTGRSCLLAVGLAGGSHWSASIEEIVDEPEAGIARIRFDVACRIKAGGGSLGSTYRSDRMERSVTDPAIVQLSDQIQVRLEAAEESRSSVLDGIFSVSPLSIPDGGPATARWQYDFVVEGV